MEEIVLRYAHSEGQTTVCYDDSGKYLLTSGCDGDIRIWEGFEDEDPKTHHMGDIVTSMAFKDGTIYLATDANAVNSYTFPNVECSGVVAQFFIDVYAISCSPDGKYVVAGGGDFYPKVFNVASKELQTYRGHDSPVLDVAIDSKNRYLASSSCDGTVKIWNMLDQTCIETLQLFKRSNDLCNSETLCHISWHPDGGKYLAIPVGDELQIYERDMWICQSKLKDENLKETFSIAKFSPCGLYVAGAANNGTIVVWDLKRRIPVFKQEHTRNLKICSLAWNPSNKKELAFCDVEGQLGVYDIVIQEKSSIRDKPNKNSVPNVASSKIKDDKRKRNMENDLDVLQDDDFINDFNTESMDGSENAFDIGAIKAKLEPVIFGDSNEADDDVGADSTINVPIEIKPKEPIVPVTPLQTSFQPSSTPLHIEQRFMLWNTTGIVRCYNTEEENSIDVEFHDASVYHPIHVNNIHGFTMASLSSEALLLAGPQAEDAASKLQCVHIGTWDTNKEWVIDMTEGEEIEAIALGTGWAAAATDKRMLRLFTVSGVQCEVFCVPGPVVCLAGQENQLAITYHKGAGIPGEQNLGLMLVKVDLKSKSFCKEYSLPISSKSYLTWLGFSDEGHLCSVDTSGMVRLLNTSSLMKWVPILDMKTHAKGKSDNYFVVGLSEIQQEIRCIPCKGSRYPAVLPRPAVSVLAFSLPFCETSTDKGRLEEEQSRCIMTYNRIKSLLKGGFDLESELAAVEKKWTDNLLKLFALATRTEREYRALDIAEFMPTPKVVEGAIRYATQRRHMAMAERLGEIMYKKMTEGFHDEDVNQITEDDSFMVENIPSSVPLRNAYSDKECQKIQPKPLKGRKSNAQLPVTINGDTQDDDRMTSDNNFSTPGDSDDDNNGASLLSETNPMINPFRVTKKQKSELNGSNNSSNSAIDDILSKTSKRLSTKGNISKEETKKQGSKQTKLVLQGSKKTSKKDDDSSNATNGDSSDTITSIKPKKTGFALYLEEHKEELQQENPDRDQKEIVKIAMKRFKDLSVEEKEKYKKPKSKDTQTAESKTNKRKDTTESGSESSEKQLKKSKKTDTSSEGSMMSKLTMFAFTKTPQS